MGFVREDLASRLEDLVDQAVALERGERQDFRDQEQHEADQDSSFHDKGEDMSPILCQISPVGKLARVKADAGDPIFLRHLKDPRR